MATQIGRGSEVRVVRQIVVDGQIAFSTGEILVVEAVEREVLKNQVAAPHQSRSPSLDLIENLVSSYYSIPTADLAGKPHPTRPQYKYVVYSKAQGRRFQLSDNDVSAIPAEKPESIDEVKESTSYAGMASGEAGRTLQISEHDKDEETSDRSLAGDKRGADDSATGKSLSMTIARRSLKVLEWIGTIVVVAIVLLVAFLMIAPKFGIKTHPIMSGSMEPKLKVGGLVVTKLVPVSSMKVGDIIGFNNTKGKMVTHRVVRISNQHGKLWFQTKGDANNAPDKDLISPTQVKVDRVIYHIPYLGYVANWMKNRWVLLPIIIVPALILLVLFSMDIRKGVAEVREKRRAGVEQADTES